MNSQPLPVAKERSRLYESVNVTAEPKTAVMKIGNASDRIVAWMSDIYIIYFVGGRELTIPENTPWFTKWRTTFLQTQNVSDHEYTKHFLGCILTLI